MSPTAKRRRDLHLLGWLRGSVRPADGIVAWRGSLRHRSTLLESAGALVQRMQQAVVQMNVQLPLVVSDLTGVTGLRILRDIVAGQRDPHQLAQHRDSRCHAAEAEIVAALTGHDRPEHVVVLGTDMTRGPTDQPVTAWRTLAPQHRMSGGRRPRRIAPRPSCVSAP